jgi:Uma2 family endonuclease
MAPPSSLIPLESGDRLTRAEFHRRYCARPDIRKAELIQGVVYVASPTRLGMHAEPHNWMAGWLFVYAARNPGVRVGDNATVFLAADVEVQPDVILFRSTAPPGGARETSDGYVEGPPQLVVEIAASSAAYDLHDKLEAYRRAGVPEYIVWSVYEKQIDWFRLRAGTYLRLEPNANGTIESEVFPGLRLAVTKMLAGDLAAVVAALDPALPDTEST